MNKDPKISHLHLRGLTVSSVIGVGVLSLPNALASSMGTDGWIAILLSGLLITLIFLMYTLIFKLHPGKDFFQIVKETLGSFIFNIVMLIFLGYLIVLLALVARNLGELIKIILLQTTPLEVIVFTFIIASSYIAIYEIDVIARAGYFVYPIIISFAFLMVLMALPKADFTRILPVFQVGLRDIIKGVGDSSFSFMGIELILFAIPFVEDQKNVVKSGVLGIATITIIYFSLFIMTLTHFSIEQIKHHVYPVLILIRQLDLPGFFLENLDGLVMALWVIVVFATVAPAFLELAKCCQSYLKPKVINTLSGD